MGLPSWKSLFESGEPDKRNLAVRVFTRGGEPLVILPKNARVPARWALALYAPQTPLARVAKRLWEWSLPLGFAPGSYVDHVKISPRSPFVTFLRKFSRGANIDGLPIFAILAGNPHAPARRFLVQVFDLNRQPVAVIKSGIGAQAGELISREADFLAAMRDADQHGMALPKMLGRLAADQLQGLAMEFVAGDSPVPSEMPGIEPLLFSWLKLDFTLPVQQFQAWKRLAQAANTATGFQRLSQRLGTLPVHPALYHGDFAPWNIKVSADKTWTVLDWERGELQGPPAWDWFHYVLQPAILVEKKTGPALAQTARDLLASESFVRYSTKAGLAGFEKEWLLAYLLYCHNVIHQSEGKRALTSLATGL